MNDISLKEIVDLYQKIGITVNEETGVEQNTTPTYCTGYASFGIYTENGFNYTNNTKS